MPKYSFKVIYCFQYGGGLTLRIFLRTKWLLDLPDLEILDSIRPSYFHFISIIGKWGGWVMASMENSILF